VIGSIFGKLVVVEEKDWDGGDGANFSPDPWSSRDFG
jgi:hypothetical protein